MVQTKNQLCLKSNQNSRTFSHVKFHLFLNIVYAPQKPNTSTKKGAISKIEDLVFQPLMISGDNVFFAGEVVVFLMGEFPTPEI